MRPGMLVSVAPPIVLTFVIFWLGLTPGLPQVASFQWADKVEHTLVFMVLAYSYLRASLYLWRAEGLAKVRWRAALTAAGVGAMLEAIQAFVPYRSAELLDLVADCVGISLAFVAARLVDGPTYSAGGQSHRDAT